MSLWGDRYDELQVQIAALRAERDTLLNDVHRLRATQTAQAQRKTPELAMEIAHRLVGNYSGRHLPEGIAEALLHFPHEGPTMRLTPKLASGRSTASQEVK